MVYKVCASHTVGANIFNSISESYRVLTGCRSVNDMLKTLSTRALSPMSATEATQVQDEIAQFMHPTIDSATWRPKTPFRYGIIHVHGPSGSGKSRLSLQLQAQLGGPEKAVILERDRFIQDSLDTYNRKFKKNYGVQFLYTPKGLIKDWAITHVFEPAEGAMITALYAAHCAGKVVIWDTMKELDSSIDLSHTLVVRMITQCLDNPASRDFDALAARKSGSMTPKKQKELASIVFKDPIYRTKLTYGNEASVCFNAYYGWKSGESQVELKVFHDLMITLFKPK